MVQAAHFVIALISLASAYKGYIEQIPNANKVPGIEAIGHVAVAGQGPRNAFGTAFGAAGKTWTSALCMADSDNDGATNGEELGDPCCTWTKGAPLAANFVATSPGTADTFTAEQLKALKCANSGSNSSSPTITTASPSGGSSSPTTTPRSGSSSTSVALAATAIALYAAAQQ